MLALFVELSSATIRSAADVHGQGALVRKQGSAERIEVAELAVSGAANLISKHSPKREHGIALVDEEPQENETDIIGMQKNLAISEELSRSACDRRRRDPCSQTSGCQLARCNPGMFVGGPMKLQQMSNGCARYMAAKEACTLKHGNTTLQWDLLEVRQFDDLGTPPVEAQWNIIDVDGTGTRFNVVNVGRQAAGCSDVYLTASASALGGDLQLEPAAKASEFEIKIYDRTNFYKIKVLDPSFPNGYLNNPTDCADGALLKLGMAEDLWRLVPFDTYGSRESSTPAGDSDINS